jgi:hypothetical protein
LSKTVERVTVLSHQIESCTQNAQEHASVSVTHPTSGLSFSKLLPLLEAHSYGYSMSAYSKRTLSGRLMRVIRPSGLMESRNFALAYAR